MQVILKFSIIDCIFITFNLDTNVLVTSGRFDSSTEFIDMKKINYNYFGDDLPVTARAGVGGVVDYKPMICSMMHSEGDGKDCFYMLNGDWKQGPNMIKARNWAAGMVLENKLWVTGGYHNDTKESSTELISLTESHPFVDLPEPMSFHCMQLINETTVFLTNFERFYFFDIISKEWSKEINLPDTMQYYSVCGVFELKKSPVMVLASGGAESNEVSLLHLDGTENGWISGPANPGGSNDGPMISTPNKDGVLMVGGSHQDSIWKLTCTETIDDCAWEETPQSMSFGKVNHIAFWLPNSFCPVE